MARHSPARAEHHVGTAVASQILVTESIEASPGRTSHLVIEGDNLDALPHLLVDHRGRVDAVFIDPPYGTGRADLAYDDTSRREQWVAFMRPRLHLIRELLTRTGIIIVAIDDREHHRLRVLMDEVFGSRQFIANVVWQGAQKNRARFVATSHDYMVIYTRSIDALKRAGANWREPKQGLERVLAASEMAWTASRGDRPAARRLMQDWFIAQPKSDPVRKLERYTYFTATGELCRDDNIGSPAPGNPRYDVLHPATGLPVPVPENGWRFTDEADMIAAIAAGRIIFRDDHTKPIAYLRPLADVTGQVPTGVFVQSRARAKQHLANVLGRGDGFPYPKDVETIERWLQIVTDGKSDALILDCFAGTGTTAEAVMRMNEADGGRRRALLITTNEGGEVDPADGIFQSVTAPRLRTLATGRRDDGSIYGQPLGDGIEFARI